MSSKHPFSQFKFCPKCGSKAFEINNEKSSKCHTCGFVYYFNSSAATVALLFNDQQELLVATRAHNPAKGSLDLPGGFVDMHETGEETICREVKEETNLDVIDVRYLFSTPNTYMYSNFEVHTLDMVYLCKVSDISKMKAADDVSELKFIKTNELNPTDFGLDSIKRIIKNINNITL